MKSNDPILTNEQIEKMIEDIKNDILNNPLKSPEEKKANLKCSKKELNKLEEYRKC